MSVEGFLCDLWCRVGELTFTFALDICWKQCENICKLNIYILILDIFCQHLGDICQLEGFCSPFGRRIGGIILKYIYL